MSETNYTAEKTLALFLTAASLAPNASCAPAQAQPQPAPAPTEHRVIVDVVSADGSVEVGGVRYVPNCKSTKVAAKRQALADLIPGKHQPADYSPFQAMKKVFELDPEQEYHRTDVPLVARLGTNHEATTNISYDSRNDVLTVDIVDYGSGYSRIQFEYDFANNELKFADFIKWDSRSSTFYDRDDESTNGHKERAVKNSTLIMAALLKSLLAPAQDGQDYCADQEKRNKALEGGAINGENDTPYEVVIPRSKEQRFNQSRGSRAR